MIFMQYSSVSEQSRNAVKENPNSSTLEDAELNRRLPQRIWLYAVFFSADPAANEMPIVTASIAATTTRDTTGPISQKWAVSIFMAAKPRTAASP